MRKIAALHFFLSGSFFMITVYSLSEGKPGLGSATLIFFALNLLFGIANAQKK